MSSGTNHILIHQGHQCGGLINALTTFFSIWREDVFRVLHLDFLAIPTISSYPKTYCLWEYALFGKIIKIKNFSFESAFQKIIKSAKVFLKNGTLITSAVQFQECRGCFI